MLGKSCETLPIHVLYSAFAHAKKTWLCPPLIMPQVTRPRIGQWDDFCPSVNPPDRLTQCGAEPREFNQRLQVGSLRANRAASQ